MSAPTLPSKAERDELRGWFKIAPQWLLAGMPDASITLRLLDWVDAQDAEIREAMKFGDTTDARIRLANMAANLGDSDDETDNEASALLGALLGEAASCASRRPSGTNRPAGLDG